MSDPVRIPLYNGENRVIAHALVDLVDADSIGNYRWTMTGGYPCRKGQVDGCTRTIFMHREVLGLARGDGIVVDHINRNAIDNRRCNLRVGTQGQNNGNKHVPFSGGSVFRGVRLTAAGTWAARVAHKHLGTFRREVDAARAAEAYRREHMPFAEPDPRLAEFYEAEPEDVAA